MATANLSLLSLFLLLAVTGALATTPTTGPPQPGVHGPLGPMAPLPPAAVACWKSILASEDCVDDILRSLARLEVRVSKVCCAVLQRIGDKCIVDAFSNFPFNPLFPPVVRQICSLAAA